MAHYLVTGGSGFIGSALVRRLLAEGHAVRVLDNQSRGHSRRLAGVEADIDLVEGDIRDSGLVRKAARGIDSVCHLAYVNGTEFFYTMPDLILEIAVKGMTNVLDACVAEGVQELVLASSSEVYQTPPVYPTPEDVALVIPDPLNPRYSYGGGKIISELLALNYGRARIGRVLVFRPHNVYGADMGWEHVVPQFILRMRELCRQQPRGTIGFRIQGDGSETRAFTYIDDCVDGIMSVISRGQHQGIYHVGTMEELPVAEVARTVARYFGRDIEIVPGPAAKGATMRRCPDISKLAALGFRPRTPFESGLPVAAKWYDANAELQPRQPQ